MGFGFIYIFFNHFLSLCFEAVLVKKLLLFTAHIQDCGDKRFSLCNLHPKVSETLRKMSRNLFESIASHCQACPLVMVLSDVTAKWKERRYPFAQRWKRSHKLALNLRTLLNQKQACLSPLARHCWTLLRLNWKVVSVCTLVDTQFGVLARSANKYSIARDF